jgi:pentatricopeptide repeat protein
MHDIWRTLAACQSKQGRHDEALKLLNETRSFQLACEGKTHNLALT